jgi:hypothetical protein
MVLSNQMAHNMSSAEMAFDHPTNTSGMLKVPDHSFSSHNLSSMSEA